ncbi:LOW QUALITY PROTEIN: primary amine oxidase-like [Carica papaya]|uniref:LOW QUALITY PROTEIN: primary amine oxidase-like n=1 Tax=Carica papaya TaxID=3649 RepID=UPI000B8CE8B4|nr:LOW QUALITY PROTEIN: primary amine oxidase-like [Carica papaya]
MDSGLKLFFLFCFISFPSICTSKHHPLDPLSRKELTLIKTILNKSYHNLTFHYVGLDEPEKTVLLPWLSRPTKKTLPPRRALVIARLHKQTHRIIVDLSSCSIISDKLYEGFGYPLLTIEEQTTASLLPLSYEPFLDSIKKRNLDLASVVCSTFTVGWFGEEKMGRRVLKIQCFHPKDTVNVYVTPIEGITLVVDLDEMKIVDYSDRIRVPVPKAEGTDYRSSMQKPPFGPSLAYAAILEPDGPGFKIDGHKVSWANWVFHVGFDVRAGPIISLASIYDVEKSKFRRVLYRGYISEIFVPYMDPSPEWYYKTFFDSGEFGLGQGAVPLEPFTDCPTNAQFMSAYYATQDGTPVKIPNAFCIFQKHAGNVMWRHTEYDIGDQVITEIRTEVTLVVRMVIASDNYDYILDWEFKPSGSINIKVSLTGVLGVKGVVYNHTDDIKNDTHGTLLANNTVGTYHDHLFTYHLDLDVDGDVNSFIKNNLVTKRVTDYSSLRKSYWTIVSETAKVESEARIQLGLKPIEMIVVNPNKKTKRGSSEVVSNFAHDGATGLCSQFR